MKYLREDVKGFRERELKGIVGTIFLFFVCGGYIGWGMRRLIRGRVNC